MLLFQDYFDIVKNPMDLSTIKRKLDTGQYQEPWQYVDDIWLMFNNAWLYNRKTSRVYKYCSKLAEVFEQEIDPVMQSLGYCCGRKVGVVVFFFPGLVLAPWCLGEITAIAVISSYIGSKILNAYQGLTILNNS